MTYLLAVLDGIDTLLAIAFAGSTLFLCLSGIGLALMKDDEQKKQSALALVKWGGFTVLLGVAMALVPTRADLRDAERIQAEAKP